MGGWWPSGVRVKGLASSARVPKYADEVSWGPAPPDPRCFAQGEKKTKNVELRATGRDIWGFADPTPALLQSRAVGNKYLYRPFTSLFISFILFYYYIVSEVR